MMGKRQKQKESTIKAMRVLAIDMHTVSYMVGDFSPANADQLRGASNMMNEWADTLECLKNDDGADAERGGDADS